MDSISQRLVTVVCELETAATHGCKSKSQPYHYQRSDIFSQLMLVTDWGRLAKKKTELDRNSDDEMKETPHAKKSTNAAVNEKQTTGGGQSSLRIKKKSQEKI
uniref:Uncharacterized protein n=1 Tax=Romanomermis culicivorax TaxID=13658 RepID=A0A915J7B5_ROMCU